ncbi:MAG: CAP domain-containing protein [Ktedonobacteraceae bacterium]
MKKICWGMLYLSLIVVLAACGKGSVTRSSSSSYVASDSLSQSVMRPSPTPTLSIPSQITTPTPTPKPHISVSNPPTSTPSSGSSCITFSNDTTLVPPKNGGLAAPYGPAPVTSEAQQLTQQLFQLINNDRAACGLPPFAWNATLASGALLHSWNMYHCGFSHTCPDGMSPYQRIANEGFANYSDCGENIGLAGPYPTPWAGVYAVQESMAHEPLGGWHRIHLFSTTLHQIGIGIYVAPNGWPWFTEDMSS